MARKAHLAAKSDEELDAYERALRVEVAAVLAERALRDSEEWQRRVSEDFDLIYRVPERDIDGE